MKSILLRLYDGEICPAEQFNLKTEEYRSMRQAHYQHYEDFYDRIQMCLLFILSNTKGVTT